MMAIYLFLANYRVDVWRGGPHSEITEYSKCERFLL
jgi:hypothetical protein